MPIQRIAHSSTEIDVENYIGILRAGQSISDTGWSIYADSAGVNPVYGLGGSPSITWSQNTVSPLSGEVDLRLVKDANNRQGNGVSIPFTVENRHLAKVLQITFDAKLFSGNYKSPIITPTTGTFTINSTTCTVTANHSFIPGQVVNMTFIGGSPNPVNGLYVITSVTATAFVFTVASGAGTNVACNYTVPADLRISIIQDPTGTPVVIEPVNTGIQLGIANQRIRHIASFQTHLSITSYRLCVHVANASTVAYTVDFANFKVWEPTQSIGAVITDPIKYTPIVQGSTTVINDEVYWTRYGKNLSLSGRLQLGTVSSSEFRLFLPFTISSEVTNLRVFGRIYVNTTYTTSPQWVLKGVGGQNYLTLGVADTTGNNAFTNMNITSAFGTNNILTFLCNEIPIAGWGSSVAMSSDSGDGRVVACHYTNVSVSSASNTPVLFTSRSFDTHNAYDPLTGLFTAPVSGTYRVSSLVACINTQFFLVFYKNTSVFGNGIGGGTNAIWQFGSSTIFLNAGERVGVAINGDSSTASTRPFISIERISAGSQVIASVEGVGCRYTSTSGQTIVTDTVILFGTRENDTHNAYNSTTGLFTAPMSGWYQIRANVVLNTNTLTFLDIQRDSSTRLVYLSYPSNRGSISTVVYLLGGQTLRVRASANTSTALSNAVGDNSLDIVRIGI